jgi:CRP-like cAMP-binding protein
MTATLAPPPGETPSVEGAAPSLSAAEALAASPFFCELSAVDLARLVPDLEERELPVGAVVFRQGDPADGFY